MTIHGGNIYKFAETSGMSMADVIDFSASINPLGISKNVSAVIEKSIDQLCHYPDPDAGKLRAEIARNLDINPESVICGNGSTELIYLVARALRPEKVLIPAPTFSEYERACRLSSGCRVAGFKLKEKDNFEINADEFIRSMKGCNAAFLCNPNNPTGRLLGRNKVLDIAKAAKKNECHLIIDEAFIDFCPEYSLIKEVKNNPYLIVLRSMTKFYALAGLRIGYGVFPMQLVKTLNKHKESWTVNTLAQNAAIAALKDSSYVNKTFRLINEEKIFLEEKFKEMDIRFFASDANFYLLKMKSAPEIYQQLRGKGILVRDCSDFKGLDNAYIRIAVKSRRENTIITKELAHITKTALGSHKKALEGNPVRAGNCPATVRGAKADLNNGIVISEQEN